MYECKTKPTDAKVTEFLQTIEPEWKREDAFRLLDIYTETTGMQPTMWGETMIGFGQYHYVYKTKHSGDAMITGFSPRKAKLTLYLYIEQENDDLLKALGKTTNGVSCVYVSKLDHINVDVLKQMILRTVEFVEKTYGKENLIKK